MQFGMPFGGEVRGQLNDGITPVDSRDTAGGRIVAGLALGTERVPRDDGDCVLILPAAGEGDDVVGQCSRDVERNVFAKGEYFGQLAAEGQAAHVEPEFYVGIGPSGG